VEFSPRAASQRESSIKRIFYVHVGRVKSSQRVVGLLEYMYSTLTCTLRVVGWLCHESNESALFFENLTERPMTAPCSRRLDRKFRKLNRWPTGQKSRGSATYYYVVVPVLFRLVDMFDTCNVSTQLYMTYACTSTIVLAYVHVVKAHGPCSGSGLVDVETCSKLYRVFGHNSRLE